MQGPVLDILSGGYVSVSMTRTGKIYRGASHLWVMFFYELEVILFSKI